MIIVLRNKKRIMKEEIITNITPIEKRGNLWFKREDLFTYAGCNGAKVRDCLFFLKDKNPIGLVTAGSRESPQINIVAHIAREWEIPCRAHTTTGELSPEVKMAQAVGAVIIQHNAGYNTVLCKRAKDEAEKLGWVYIPFGMECRESIQPTKNQVSNIPPEVKRIVVACGSGMNLCAILWGLREHNMKIPVLAVRVGANIERQLIKYAPLGWQMMVKIVKSPHPYSKSDLPNIIEGIIVDPIYESKALPFLQGGDLFWIIGIRKSVEQYENKNLL